MKPMEEIDMGLARRCQRVGTAKLEWWSILTLSVEDGKAVWWTARAADSGLALIDARGHTDRMNRVFASTLFLQDAARGHLQGGKEGDGKFTIACEICNRMTVLTFQVTHSCFIPMPLPSSL